VTDKILALWAVPRSTSTAFEWMMRVRGDMTCFHEPFGEVWYQGDEPDWPRYETGVSVHTPDLTYESRWAEVQAAAAQHPVFVKDFPMHLERVWTDEFLARFTHSFLIRHPAKTVTSMFKHWPDFVIEETGFLQQRQLFDRLTEANDGVCPPTLDSDDLFEDPRRAVERWSSAVGIRFRPDALSWDPGARDEVSWWDGGSFHQNLRESDGLRAQPKTSIDLAAAPARVQEIVAELLPHYEHLRAHRLGIR
jgi:hypothetical protein